MSSRTLGKSGIAVSPQGLRCWAMGGIWKWLGGPVNAALLNLTKTLSSTSMADKRAYYDGA